MYKKIVVVAAEKMSSMVNYKDRATCPLFGDASGCMLVEPTEEQGVGIIDGVFHTDGNGLEHLVMLAGVGRTCNTRNRGCRTPLPIPRRPKRVQECRN